MSKRTNHAPSRQQASAVPATGAQGSGSLRLEQKSTRFWVASVALHTVIAVALFASFNIFSSRETMVIPDSINIRVVSLAELKKLQNQQVEQKRQEAPPPPPVEPPKQQEQEEQRKAQEAERQRQEAEKQRQAEQKRREAEAQKKLLLQKKLEEEKKEKERKEKEIKDKERKEKELKDKQQKEKQEQERKRQEQLKKEQQEKERKEKERKDKELKEKFEAFKKEQERQQAEKAAQAAQAAEQQRRAQAAAQAASYEQGEVARFMRLIKERVEQDWYRPPEASKLVVYLEISLFPNGEVADVKIVESSGSPPFDRSALSAVQQRHRFPVPENKDIFERHFRKFNMLFRGED